MFNSRRAVDRVYARHPVTGFYLVTRVSSPIYLLVGRRDRVNPNPGTLVVGKGYSGPEVLTYMFGPNIRQEPKPVAEDGLANFRDLKNLWVALNPQTGYAACAEVTAAGPVYWSGSPVLDTTGSYTLYDFAAARGLAAQFRSMGGR
jgi:hypothetical protein